MAKLLLSVSIILVVTVAKLCSYRRLKLKATFFANTVPKEAN